MSPRYVVKVNIWTAPGEPSVTMYLVEFDKRRHVVEPEQCMARRFRDRAAAEVCAAMCGGVVVRLVPRSV